MSEKLSIKNFGPIVAAEIEVKRTTAFAGARDSGGQLAGRLLHVFRGMKALDANNLQPLFDRLDLTRHTQPTTAIKYETEFYTIDYSNGKFSVALGSTLRNLSTGSGLDLGALLKEHKDRVAEHGRLMKEIAKKSDALFSELEEKPEAPKPEPKKAKKSKKKTEPSDGGQAFLAKIERNAEAFEKALKRSIELFKSADRNPGPAVQAFKIPVHIPAERHLVSALSDSIFERGANKIADPPYMEDFLSLFLMARRNAKTGKVVGVDGATFSYDNGVDLVANNGSKPAPLSEANPSAQAIVPLQWTIEETLIPSDKNVDESYVVEEPESQLLPAEQKAVVDYLAEKCVDASKYLVLATDSPFVLMELNNLLTAKRVADEKGADKVKNLVPENRWIDPAEFAAYKFEGGKVVSIFDGKAIDEKERQRGLRDLVKTAKDLENV
jgi:hypothetical protein